MIISNLQSQRRKRRPPEGASNYNVGIEEEKDFPKLNLGDLFDETSPQSAKQITEPSPPYEAETPSYEVEEQEPVEEVDEGEVSSILDDAGLLDYDSTDALLSSLDLSETKKRNIIEKKILEDAVFRRNQLKAYKTGVVRKFNKGKITEAQRDVSLGHIEKTRKVINDYIHYYKKKKLKAMKTKGSGMKRSKNVTFCNNPKVLLKKLELIVGEILAGNNNADRKNTGVAILDILLESSLINMRRFLENTSKMDREIVLSSYSVKDEAGNTPENFTTRFTRSIVLDNNSEYAVGLNRIINMSFTWFSINPGYPNQLIRYSSDAGNTFTDISFPVGVWNYVDINEHIQKATVIKDSQGKEEFPISLEFNETTFRVTIMLKTGYQLDFTRSNFYNLLGFDKKILTNQVNVGPRVPNLSQDTDILNVHCDLISESLVDGQDTDIIYSFSTSVLRPSYSFTLDLRRVTFNPVNKRNISSIRIYITDGKRRLINLNGIDTAFSLLLRKTTKNMKCYEFARRYNPRLGRFVCQHKGSGVVVDNIFKPMKSIVSTVAKPFTKKILKTAEKQASKKISEKSGDLIRKKLANNVIEEPKEQKRTIPKQQKSESADDILNRLISGGKLKRKKEV